MSMIKTEGQNYHVYLFYTNEGDPAPYKVSLYARTFGGNYAKAFQTYLKRAALLGHFIDLTFASANLVEATQVRDKLKRRYGLYKSRSSPVTNEPYNKIVYEAGPFEHSVIRRKKAAFASETV